MNVILNLASRADRRIAAIAITNGAPLFYGFGNFCALAALPDLASMQRVNFLKGRPLAQAGSVTTTPDCAHLVFDAALPAVVNDFLELGPIGFRGPASDRVPNHLTVMDGDVRTVQLISPGLRCPSNALVGEILDRSGEHLLFITSANTSGNVSKQVEAAHCEMRAIRDEFGDHPEAVLIGHADERAARAMHTVASPLLDDDHLVPPRASRARAPRLARDRAREGDRGAARARARDREPRARARALAGDRRGAARGLTRVRTYAA